MPVTIVVGGQYGSEGKGKVAHHIARATAAKASVRVGGPNSGHTVVTPGGRTFRLRHLPTAAVLPDVVCVLGAGSYIDVERLLSEIEATNLAPARLCVDPKASIISAEDKRAETDSRLRQRVGSTLSGTGAAVRRRVLRSTDVRLANDEPRLKAFLGPANELLREILERNGRVLIEGTQGFGLSLLHGPAFPFATSRDTTAAGFLAESGLSPFDVDDVALVIRAFPIRVAGNSGPLENEIDWPTVTQESGSPTPIVEHTTVTNLERRVARFDPAIVRSAIRANRPTRVFLNHVDYVDWSVRDTGVLSETATAFVRQVEDDIGQPVDAYGFSPAVLVEAERGRRRARVVGGGIGG